MWEAQKGTLRKHQKRERGRAAEMKKKGKRVKENIQRTTLRGQIRSLEQVKNKRILLEINHNQNQGSLNLGGKLKAIP